jgi:MoaD family protein
VATITVRFYTFLRHLLGIDSLSLEAENVGEVISLLEEKFESRFQEQVRLRGIKSSTRLRDSCLLLLNGLKVDMENSSRTELREGDVLHIFPPAAGG